MSLGLDRTIVNLTSLLLGGAGLFTVLTGFNVPETTSSFYGENPFAIKRDAIETAMDWIFSGVALVALALQLFAEIFSEQLPNRLYGPQLYVAFAIAGLVVVVTLVWLLGKLGRVFARRTWLPRVVGAQGDLFKRAAFIVEHDGWTEEEFPNISSYSAAYQDERRKSNLDQAAQHLSQIERLFEIRSVDGLDSRVKQLRQEIPQAALGVAPTR
jgi:hypothetical protein